MGLFKDVKKPVIRQAAVAGEVSPKRPRFAEKAAPCVERCAAGTDVRAWLNVIAQAKEYGRTVEEAYEAAWRILAETNPFPATLARICPHPCERDCTRGAKDGAVAIAALEGYLGDLALSRGFELPRLAADTRPEPVAIVGGGPAGLSCAYQLARRGYRPTVHEARPQVGGRLRDAQRTGRLSSVVLDAEIERLATFGVGFTCSARVDEEGLDTLRGRSRAVFVATGRLAGSAFPEAVPGDATAAQDSNRLLFAVAEAVKRVDGGTLRRSADDAAPLVAGGDMIHPGLVAAALAQGRLAAVAIDAWVRGLQPGSPPVRPGPAVSRVQLGWFKPVPRHPWTTVPERDPDDPGSWEALEAEVTAEAARCLSCGLCMDCDSCWMYCTAKGFERLPKGQHYRVLLDRCNGCSKCADVCPTGYIDMV